MKKRIGIISDLHLNYRQYGLKDREEDFYKQYHCVISECINYDCDSVIIAGDIFDNHNPSPKAISVFEKGIDILNNHNIPVYNIVGNHTQLQVRDHVSPDSLFKTKYDYYLLDEDSYCPSNGLFICGLPYYANHSLDTLKNHISELNDMAAKYEVSILVLHQEFQEYCGFTGAHMSINDIEINNFDFVICGHIHSHTIDKLNDKTTFIQPGSIERLNIKESEDERKYGKGITIIDIDGDKTNVDFVRIDNFRKIFSEEIVIFEDSQDTVENFDVIFHKLSECKHPPILQLKIFDKFDQLDLCKEWERKFSDVTLMTRMSYYDEKELDISVSDLQDKDLSPLNGLKNAIKDWNENEINLAIDLFLKLSSKNKDVVSSAQSVVDDYFENNFDI